MFGELGDWCTIDPFCPEKRPGIEGCGPGRDFCGCGPETTTAFYYIKSLEDLIKMATVTGHTADASRYTQMLSSAKTGYHRAFFNTSTGDYGQSQTGNVLAIAAGIPPDAAAMSGALATLTASIEAQGKHLSTGGV
eukprot:COSAG04_NODE_12663_length_641_cov_0.948339_1_plen_135_part_10